MQNSYDECNSEYCKWFYQGLSGYSRRREHKCGQQNYNDLLKNLQEHVFSAVLSLEALIL